MIPGRWMERPRASEELETKPNQKLNHIYKITTTNSDDCLASSTSSKDLISNTSLKSCFHTGNNGNCSEERHKMQLLLPLLHVPLPQCILPGGNATAGKEGLTNAKVFIGQGERNCHYWT